jgi:uncharacterized protein (DUF362 family)
MNDPIETGRGGRTRSLSRRKLLLGGALAAAGIAGYRGIRRAFLDRASVFIARDQRYDGSLARTIRDGLAACGFDAGWVRGRRVLLKPNLVEPTREAPHMTTHPTVVRAAAEVFLQWGADVLVGEAPAHVRDTELALLESGLEETLAEAKLGFADLNYEEVTWVKNAGRASRLPGFFLPRSVAQADLIVSMPKMKTHHWAGATAAMKNMYGVMPGIKYGWPKNVLHYAGIPQTVYDINATIPKTIAVIDAIECMEGDGPIMGTRKQMGLVLVGLTPAAVDATVCRLMDLNAARIGYLKLAANRLGPIDEFLIEQRGEPWQPLVSRFEILDRPHLRILRASHGLCGS